MKMKDDERRVLRYLADFTREDETFTPFAPIGRYTKLSRREVRRYCRSLTRKGLASYAKGLCGDDGEFLGAGYGITAAGCQALESPEDARRAPPLY